MTRKQRALEQLYWKCNKIGMDAMPFAHIDDYKALQDATEEEREAIYNLICDGLGFSDNSLTKEQHKLLKDNGYI